MNDRNVQKSNQKMMKNMNLSRRDFNASRVRKNRQIMPETFFQVKPRLLYFVGIFPSTPHVRTKGDVVNSGISGSCWPRRQPGCCRTGAGVNLNYARNSCEATRLFDACRRKPRVYPLMVIN